MTHYKPKVYTATKESEIVHRPTRQTSVGIPHLTESTRSVMLREKNKRIAASIKNKEKIFF